jgi:hypothetical protein
LNVKAEDFATTSPCHRSSSSHGVSFPVDSDRNNHNIGPIFERYLK